jgi:cell wall assembly regulator SMI1
MKFSAYIAKLQKIYGEQHRGLTMFAPATDAEIKKTDKRLGFSIEPRMCAAWQVCNGCDAWQPVFVRPGYCTGYDFLSLDEAIKARASMKRRAPQYQGYEDPGPRDKRIQSGWFQEGWLPFAAFGGGSLLLIQDYSPTAKGKVAQIIAYTHDPDEIRYVAADFVSFLKRSIKEIAADPEELFA